MRRVGFGWLDGRDGAGGNRSPRLAVIQPASRVVPYYRRVAITGVMDDIIVAMN